MRDGDAPGSGPPRHEPATPALLGAAAQVFVDDLDALMLAPDDQHHLAKVLRLRRGEVVVAADGAGRWRPCRFVGADSSADSEAPMLEPDGHVVMSVRAEPEVTVAFVPVKGDRPEWVVQKLTEAGVDRIVVLESRRAVVRWEGERLSRALDRLRHVAQGAAAQSRRAWLPEVIGVADLDALRALLHPVPLSVAQIDGEPPSTRAPAVAVGPEGGWDASETAGRPLVSLGPHMLRAETAAVAAGLLLCALREGVVGPAVAPTASSGPGTKE